jgi:copper resistance protein B
MTMKKLHWQYSFTLLLAMTAASSNAEEHEHQHDHGDDPLLTHVIIDQLEKRYGDDANPTILDSQMWVGKDINKLWLKADLELDDGKTQESEIQALYSRAISSYWDGQIGIMHSSGVDAAEPNRNWGVIGLHGLAPYWFDVDTALFVGESGRVAARFSVEYELLFTQKLILSPEIEMNFYGQNDTETGTGSGLSDVNAGLRLRYEIRREFAPYVGLNWHKTFGNTAEFAKITGEPVSDTTWVIGLRAWL